MNRLSFFPAFVDKKIAFIIFDVLTGESITNNSPGKVQAVNYQILQ
jgi:hypothetical protein